MERRQNRFDETVDKSAKRTKRFWIILSVGMIALIVCGVTIGRFVTRVTDTRQAFANMDQSTLTKENEIIITHDPATFDSNQTSEPVLTQTPEPTLSPEELLAQQADLDFLQERINILVLGLDRSEERLASNSFRTDTMILVSIDIDNNTVDMISIPRDSYVKIYNKKSRTKINSAFGVGGGAQKNGYEYVAKTVSNLFGGVTIHYYVGFDMNLVKEVVDAMGGVDYDVDIEVKMNGRQLSPGEQHLDGQAVLDYCRQRKGSSDVARAERQQRMLVALFNQLKSTKQITKIPSIYNAVKNNLDTNLDFTQICSLAYFATGLNTNDISRHMVEGDYLYMNSICYWGISNTKLKKMVEEIFGIQFSPDAEQDVYTLKRRVAEQEKAAQEAAQQQEDAETENKDSLEEPVVVEKIPEENVEIPVDGNMTETTEEKDGEQESDETTPDTNVLELIPEES